MTTNIHSLAPVDAQGYIPFVRTYQLRGHAPRQHVIVCGYGRHGRLLLDKIISRRESISAVVIDRDPSIGPFVSRRSPGRADIPVLHNDFENNVSGCLHDARVNDAEMLVAATGNDVLNVAICLAARDIVGERGPLLLALVSDEALAEGFRSTLRTLNIRTRNTYKAAASNLLRKHLREHLKREHEKPLALIIIGCGRFGTALATAAQQMCVDGFQVSHIGMVDLAANRRLNVLRDGGTAFRLEPTAIEGDAEDPETLRMALRQCPRRADVLVALCTDNDAANLRLTFRIERNLRGRAVLLTRSFDSPPESVRSILAQRKVQFFDLHQLIASEIDADLEQIGKPRASADLRASET